MARIKHYNRKTNKWEYADSSFTVGGNIDYYEQPEAPDDAPVGSLWYDTDEMPPDSSGGISITGATVGQTVKIVEVDENGVPTAWEPTDFPSGGSGCGEEYETIVDTTLTKASSKCAFSTDLNGGSFVLRKLIVELTSTGSGWSPNGGATICFNDRTINKGSFTVGTNSYTQDNYIYCFPSKPDAITTETYTGHLFARWELEITENGVIFGKGRTGVLWEDADGKFYLPSGNTSSWNANTINYFTSREPVTEGIYSVHVEFNYNSLPAGSHIVVKGIRM